MEAQTTARPPTIPPAIAAVLTTGDTELSGMGLAVTCVPVARSIEEAVEDGVDGVNECDEVFVVVGVEVVDASVVVIS